MGRIPSFLPYFPTARAERESNTFETPTNPQPMSPSYKPTDYNALSPYCIVPDAPRFIELLQTVFGATELRSFPRPDGTLAHAEMRIDDSILMLGEATEQYPPQPIVLHVYVAELDTTWEKALAAGCTPIEAPKQLPGDPDRRATFQDYVGNFWSIGTQVQG